MCAFPQRCQSFDFRWSVKQNLRPRSFFLKAAGGPKLLNLCKWMKWRSFQLFNDFEIRHGPLISLFQKSQTALFLREPSRHKKWPRLIGLMCRSCARRPIIFKVNIFEGIIYWAGFLQSFFAAAAVALQRERKQFYFTPHKAHKTQYSKEIDA